MEEQGEQEEEEEEKEEGAWYTHTGRFAYLFRPGNSG